MCLIVKSGPYLATKDISVYKVVNYNGIKYETPFRHEIVEIGKCYSSEIGISNYTTFKPIIDKGLHSLLNGDHVYHIAYNYINSNLSYYPFYKKMQYALCECIITEGSTYYIGIDNDIVSNRLYYNKVLRYIDYEEVNFSSILRLPKVKLRKLRDKLSYYLSFIQS